uniref:MFS domain-containing protein n=1 Tax=Panagrellus redivivus TaxID=6233 RepID=A0A7E4VNS6_PANRE
MIELAKNQQCRLRGDAIITEFHLSFELSTMNVVLFMAEMGAIRAPIMYPPPKTSNFPSHPRSDQYGSSSSSSYTRPSTAMSTFSGITLVPQKVPSSPETGSSSMNRWDTASSLPESNAPPKPDTVCGRMLTRGRFIMALLTLLCLSSIWSNIIAFNFCLVCLSPEEQDTQPTTLAPNPFFGNGESETPLRHQFAAVNFSKNQETALTAVLAATALISNFIVIPLMTRFGPRLIFTIFGLLSSVATVFLPAAMHTSFAGTLVLRGLQGAAFAVNFPMIGVFASRWSYYKQNGLAVSSLVAFVQLSPTISDPISGALCKGSLGWTSVLYGHAIVGCVLFILWGITYRNTPGKHPLLSAHEKFKVTINKPIQTKSESAKIPYAKILKTGSVWAVWIASLGNFFCVNVIFLFSPNYLHYVLKMNVSSTGASSAVPAILQFVVKVAAGAVSDKIYCISDGLRLRLFNSIAFFGSAACLIALAFMSGHESSTSCFIVLSVATGFLGFATGGFFKAGPMVARQYSQFVTGNVACGVDITMIIVPFVIGGIASNNTADEWKIVFLIIAGVQIVTNIIFCIMCRPDPAEWTITAAEPRRGTSATSSTPISSISRAKIAPA